MPYRLFATGSVAGRRSRCSSTVAGSIAEISTTSSSPWRSGRCPPNDSSRRTTISVVEAHDGRDQGPQYLGPWFPTDSTRWDSTSSSSSPQQFADSTDDVDLGRVVELPHRGCSG